MKTGHGMVRCIGKVCRDPVTVRSKASVRLPRSRHGAVRCIGKARRDVGAGFKPARVAVPVPRADGQRKVVAAVLVD